MGYLQGQEAMDCIRKLPVSTMMTRPAVNSCSAGRVNRCGLCDALYKGEADTRRREFYSDVRVRLRSLLHRTSDLRDQLLGAHIL